MTTTQAKKANYKSLLSQSLMHGLKTNLKNAITEAGGTVDDDLCLWKYPEAIREMMAEAVKSINLEAAKNDIIKIEQTDNKYIISTSIDTTNIDRPNYVKTEWKNDEMSVKEVIEDLFENVLSEVPTSIDKVIATTDEILENIFGITHDNINDNGTDAQP